MEGYGVGNAGKRARGYRNHLVQKLANAIIDAQRKEMEWLINDIRDNRIAETKAEADLRSVPTFAPTPE